MARLAQGDIERAARYLMAFQRGEQNDEAEAGALLLADALVSVRGLEQAQATWKHGRSGL